MTAKKSESIKKSVATFEEVKNREQITESDAVHPRFADPPAENDVANYHRTFDYFCPTCYVYFAPTVLGLREHFKKGRIDHTFKDKCVYCKMPVYEYTLNERTKKYHECTKSL